MSWGANAWLENQPIGSLHFLYLLLWMGRRSVFEPYGSERCLERRIRTRVVERYKKYKFGYDREP
jgi:hypothetical protein